ncbi:hypothetical protein ACWDG1_50420, partial [Streptomyces sp. NPDC001177]
MSARVRAAALAYASAADLDRLAGDPLVTRALQDGLSPEEFAVVAAHLMVRVPESVERPVSARNAAVAQLARMLGGPGVAERVLATGVRVTVVPRSEAMTSLSAFRHLAGQPLSGQVSGGRVWDDVRGVGGEPNSAVTEENLLGEAPGMQPVQKSYADGYSTTTHEMAHTLHEYALSDAEKKAVEKSFRGKRQQGHSVQWPDGPRRDVSGRERDNYSSMTAQEYFAQVTNAYLGTNAGHDPFTGQPRNNGPQWVRRHEQAILPILERLYGKSPTPVAPVNPVEATSAENDVYDGYRAFWDHVEAAYVPRPHDLLPQQEPTEADTAGLTATGESTPDTQDAASTDVSRTEPGLSPGAHPPPP